MCEPVTLKPPPSAAAIVPAELVLSPQSIDAVNVDVVAEASGSVKVATTPVKDTPRVADAVVPDALSGASATVAVVLPVPSVLSAVSWMKMWTAYEPSWPYVCEPLTLKPPELFAATAAFVSTAPPSPQSI